MMEFRYSQSEFNDLLSLFQSAIECGEYTEKIRYDTWRKLKKLTGPIIIEYESPFVGIKSCTTSADGTETWDIVYSAKVYNLGFGRFFYDYFVKEKEQMTNSNIAYDDARILYVKTDDASSWTKLGTATSATISTDGTAWEYRYSDRTSVYPSNINTNINITTLDDRINWLENEIQKKVDKAEIEVLKNRKEKENDTMMKGINFDFGPCGSTVRMSMYGMAIQNISGEWVSYNPDSHEIINVDVFNIADGGKYMYKMPVAIADIKKGDIVIHNRVPMFVTAINKNGTFEVTDVRAGETKNIIPTRSPFGFNFITKVVSMFGAFTDAPSADQPFGNMLPFLMMGDENGKDIDPVMLMFLMNQGGNNGMNPMMWYFMFKDNKDNKDIDPAVMWMITSMVAGSAPSFMTGNYPKTLVASGVQATPNFMAGNSPNTAFISDVQK